MRSIFLIVATLTLAAFAQDCVSAATYRYELFRVDGAPATVASGINNDGVVVGFASFGSSARDRRGFIRSANGTLDVINYPNGYGNQLNGTNNLGQSIGSYWRLGIGPTAFRVETDGAFTEILGIGSDDINDHGQILGEDYGGIAVWEPDREVVWGISSEYISAGGLNNRGIVVASVETEGGEYHWRGRIFDSANDTSQYVDFPGARSTFLYGVNNLDQVVGTWSALSGEGGVFLRKPDGTFEDLTPPAPGDLIPNDINDHGQIAGLFIPDGDSIRYGFVATPVPEPSSFVLLALGAGVLAVFRRRTSARRDL